MRTLSKVLKFIAFSLIVLLHLDLPAQDLPDSIGIEIQKIPEPPEEDKKSFRKKIQNLGISKGIKKTKANLSITVSVQQAKLAEQQHRYLTAISHYQKVVDIYVEQGDQQSVTDYMQQIALLYQQAGRTQQALDKYEEVLQRKEFYGDTTNLAIIRENLINLEPTTSDTAEITLPDPVTSELLTKKEAEDKSNRLKVLAEKSEDTEDYKQSLEYFKLYTELTTKQKEAEQAQQLALQEKTFQLEKQAQEMSLLESEKEVQALTLARQQEQLQKEETFKRNLIVGVVVLTLAAFISFVLYRGKRQALGNLNQAYKELSTTKNKLESAEKQLKRLLGQQVSIGVAQQLMDHDKADAGQKKFVCVMFLDIRGFTPFAEKLKPEELIKYQNDVFGLMIEIVDQYHGVINQFLGDGFMATFGLQENEDNVCDNAIKAAMEIVRVVNDKSETGSIPETRVGIGLHAGNVVAGNVGTSIRKQYSITGNTVITAARIEQLNKQYHSQILISKEVYAKLSQPEKLPDSFINAQVKGRKQPVELLKIA